MLAALAGCRAPERPSVLLVTIDTLRADRLGCYGFGLAHTPAIDGLKREWGEAAATLGATQLQYWRMVVIPVIWPSFLGTVILLFANSFGAIATAYALTGSSLNIVPILLYAQIRGDVLHNPHLGYALAFGMIVITGIANVFYIWFRTRSERWLK